MYHVLPKIIKIGFLLIYLKNDGQSNIFIGTQGMYCLVAY